MAVYQDPKFFVQQSDQAFDKLHNPGEIATHSGIYRCEVCGHEDVSTRGNPLPPQNHHQHNPPRSIKWRLIVSHTARAS